MTTANDLRKLVLVMTLGLCDALEERVLPIDEASHYLFSPRTMRLFGNDHEVKEIIHLATEFEDLARLAPDALGEAIANVRKRALTALKNTPPCDYQQDSWLNKLRPIER